MSSLRPRVLFVGAFPPADRKVFGGMVTSCRALLNSTLPARLDLDLLDTTQVSHPPPPLPIRFLLAALRVRSFIAKFERRRPDAILLFTAIGASVVEKGFMAWYARVRGVPALMFPRGGSLIELCERSRLTRIWVKFAFRGARMILCQGPAWQEFSIRTLGFSKEAAPIVANWTATEEFLQIGRSRKISVSAVTRLLFVGWLDREKGVSELLEACRVLAARQAFELVLIGEGNHLDDAQAYVRDNALSGIVSFRGWLDGDALRNELAAADVFVLPSWSEGLPNAMIEAMASKLVVVVSAVGNIPSVIQNEVNGLLVPPRNPNALACALSRLLVDTSLRSRLADAGFLVAENRFGVEKAVDGISASVETAMKWRGAATAVKGRRT